MQYLGSSDCASSEHASCSDVNEAAKRRKLSTEENNVSESNNSTTDSDGSTLLRKFLEFILSL